MSDRCLVVLSINAVPEERQKYIKELVESVTVQQDGILVADPFGRCNPRLVVAAARALALGVLDLTGPVADGQADEALAVVEGLSERPWAVRIRPGTEVSLPDGAATVVLNGYDLAAAASPLLGRRVLAEVTSLEEARLALAAGAAGLLVKGNEAGGRVGPVEGFILAQQVRALGAPWWLASGMGPHTVAAAIVAGATGVVLSDILALVDEARPGLATANVIASMDGSETRVVGGHQVWSRPGSPASVVPAGSDLCEVLGRLGDDARSGLVPAGPDTAMAADAAARWRTVGGAVDGMRRRMEQGLAAARRQQPLAPGSLLAERHRLRYPLAQGPMTRVSDSAPFAAAVAAGGALPFLALALLSGPEVRRLMVDTAAAVGDRPWGVGVLGFVPPEVRQAQLEVVLELKPPLALIAGGRPSQARALEETGIATFIHVPSPGLLEQFLAQGARRFVFEGRECGGHVGPRTSLALWEAQLEVLERHPDVSDVEVLVAGGIHDAMSAAMVSAVLGPLAERGAAVGVLMGTAYLFTEEAVSAGAITAAYQAAAVGCRETVLLETSPGHATRCVESPYVQAFARRKAELAAAGTDSATMWAELEELNLGRLRMASKGVTRCGDELVELDAEAQAEEGMFMIGQIATLRDGVTTVAALHEEISSGPGRLLGETPAQPAVSSRHRPPAPLDVAIVGMAGVFPGAADVEAFWADVVAGADKVTEVPPARWSADRYYDPEAAGPMAGRRTPSKWGGFIPAVGFDPLAYGIPPASLAAIEPVQLLALSVASRALEDAGYSSREFARDRTSVIFGAEGGTDLQGAYNFRSLAAQYLGQLPQELEQYLPVYTEDSFPGVLTNVIAGRIANRLDLGGVNYTVDAACASALAALDAACKELVAGGSDMVLCGGADLHNGINDYLLFSSVRALSPSGRSRPFDAESDGIALGEAVVCVALKRRADAERDGDRIYAVIDGLGGSSDGRHLGLTAPRKEGQQVAVRRAYAQAGYGPERIGLVEAHGTGTAVGDRTELATLTESFAGAGAVPGSVVLGSVKSQVGHTKCAAGLVGLVKIARSVHHGVLPPTLHVNHPHPTWDPQSSPFRFLSRVRPWVGTDRRAAVSAFGFGGTNFHAVISSPPGGGADHGVGPWPAELFLIRDSDLERARARAGQLAATAVRVAEADPHGHHHRLRDLAYTVSSGAAPGSDPGAPVQVAVVARSWADLAARLDAASRGVEDATGVFLSGGADPGRVAFVYPGQGSQRPGMLADLFVAFPWLAPVLEAGRAWTDVMFPAAPFGPGDEAAQLAAATATENAQPTLGIAAVALTRLWARLGVHPDAAAGHSYGELAALAAAGCFDMDALLAISAARAEAMLGAAAALGDDAGAMAAVSLSADEVRRRLGPAAAVAVANDNSPRQSVISGPSDAVSAAVAALGATGVGTRRLNVACAFHSPLVAGGSETLRLHLDRVSVAAGRIPVIAGSTAAAYPSEPDGIRGLLAGGIAAPVRWVEQVEALYSSGVRTFIEAGPGRVLTQLIGSILGDRPHTAVASDVAGEPGITRFLLAAARLATVGVEIDTEPLYAGRARAVDPGRFPLAAPGWTIDGHLVRTSDGAVVAGSLQPADSAPEVDFGARSADAATISVGPFDPSPEDHREATVLGYLDSMQKAIAAQRDVMLRYLGVAAPGAVTGFAGATPVEIAAVPAPSASALPTATPPPAGRPADPAPPSDPPPPVMAAKVPEVGPGGGGVLGLLMEIVSERTGYPVSMLDPDADLEADLSIDSIKRLEVLSEFMDRAGLGGSGDSDALIEEVARIQTLSGIVTWMGSHSDRAPAPAAATSPAATSAAATSVAATSVAATSSAATSVAATSVAATSVAATSVAATSVAATSVAATSAAATSAAATSRAATSPAATTSSADAGMAAATSAPVGTGRSPVADILGLLVEIVSERTGYPVSMLDPDADLEADLSIDSIKRLEVLSEFMDRAGLGGSGDSDALIEEVARIKTLSGIVTWMAGRDASTVIPPPAPTDHPTTRTDGPGRVEGPGRAPLGRFALGEAVAPAIDAAPVAGQRVAVMVHGGSAVADQVCAQLRVAGAEAVPVYLPVWPNRTEASDLASLDRVDSVVYVGALEPGVTVDARSTFAAWRAARTARRWLAVTADGGFVASSGESAGGALSDRPDGARAGIPTGLAGLLRVAALETPGLTVRCLDLASELVGADPSVAARWVLEELSDRSPTLDVARRGDLRVTPRLGPVPGAAAGRRPDSPEPLDADSVVLLTGGARGITAAVGRRLHARFGCRLEIVGRSRAEADEDPRLAGAVDLNGVRRVLAQVGEDTDLAAVDRRARRVLAAREVRSTLAELAGAGARVRYHAVDVSDPAALSNLVHGIYERHGRLDAVIHGAGVIDDRLMGDKEPDSFATVYSTKVDAARTILEQLRAGPGVVVLFASVSGVFGNRGQVDYAAANNALDCLARRYDGHGGWRVVSLDWGPWAGAGMVTDSLAREYERRGVPLIGLDEGVEVVLEALAPQGLTPSQMVVMPSGSESAMDLDAGQHTGIGRDSGIPAGSARPGPGHSIAGVPVG